MRNLLIKLLLIACAALGGVLAGQAYSALLFGQAQAGDPTPVAAMSGVPPEWSELHTLYFGPDPATDERVAYLADTLQTVVAQRVTSPAAVALFSAQHGTLHFVFIEQSALSQVDAVWAREQFANGAAFIGFNIHPTALGKLINNQRLVSWYADKPIVPTPGFSFAGLYMQGDPAAIDLLRAHHGLYPPDDALEETLGISVAQVESGGYGIWQDDGLARVLNRVRQNMCDHGQLCWEK